MEIETKFVDDNKILISSPHEKQHGRIEDGEMVKLESQFRIGYLRRYIEKEKLANTIWIDKDDAQKDAARNNGDEFKYKIREISKNRTIKYLIDIHNMKTEHQELICVATNSGINSGEELKETVVRILKKNGLEVNIDKPFGNTNPELITSWCKRELKIDSIGIIINNKIFDNSQERKKLYDAIKEMLIELKK